MLFHYSAYTYTASSTAFQNDVEMQILGPTVDGRHGQFCLAPRVMSPSDFVFN